MNMAILFGKFREHELELGRLKEDEVGEKRHIVALKTIAKAVVKFTTKRTESVIEGKNEKI